MDDVRLENRTSSPCAAENIVDMQRGFLARQLLTVVVLFASLTISSTAEAGPLLDWLFHRNRSQGLNSPTCPFGNCSLFNNRRSPAAGYGAYGATGRSPAVAANPAAVNPYATNPAAANQYASAAGYAPQSGCGAGWCQETVVRYVPQIAYRTMYQPVPVTTYKTSTSINPSTGLPRTCTRPCTSYNYQARRVPYTTYRPVYTTVPVADSWGTSAPSTAGYAPQAPGYSPTYAYQPPSQSGCSSCQNNAGAGYGATGYGGGSGYSNWSSAPGYTPGNATMLPPSASQGWPNPGAPDYAQATPWRSESNASEWRPEPGYRGGAPSYREPDYGDTPGGYSATPWRSDPNAPPPTYGGGAAADERPRLRPNYDEEYEESTFRPLKPKPMTEEMRRMLNDEPSGASSSSYRYDTRRDNYAYSRQRDMFRTPRDQGYEPAPVRPPSNQIRSEFDSRSDDDYRGGIRALDTPRASDWNFGDKTARQSPRSPRGSEMPLIEESMRTRYAAAPINWADNHRRPRQGNSQRNRNEYDSVGRGRSSYQDSDWTPIR